MPVSLSIATGTLQKDTLVVSYNEKHFIMHPRKDSLISRAFTALSHAPEAAVIALVAAATQSAMQAQSTLLSLIMMVDQAAKEQCELISAQICAAFAPDEEGRREQALNKLTKGINKLVTSCCKGLKHLKADDKAWLQTQLDTMLALWQGKYCNLAPEFQVDLACAGIMAMRKQISKIIEMSVQHAVLSYKHGRCIRHTMLPLVKAICLVMGRGSNNSFNLAGEIYYEYVHFCRIANQHPCSYNTLNAFFNENTQRLKTKHRKGDDNHVEPFFDCLLTRLANTILCALREISSKLRIGDGHFVLEAVQHKLKSIERIIACDGTTKTIKDGSDRKATMDGGEPEDCKGLTGTCARAGHALRDLVSGVIFGFCISSGVFSERKLVFKMLKDKVVKAHDLLIFDAGYLSKDLFEALTAAGVYFVCKGKQSANPQVVSYTRYETHKSMLPAELKLPLKHVSDWLRLTFLTRGYPARSQKLKDIPCGKHACLDAKVHMGKAGDVRLVKLYNEHRDRDGGDCEPYVVIYTNLPESFSAMEIWALSRCRWQVELSFKHLKSFCFMDDWQTDRIGRADFYILMAMVSYHIKLIFAQQIQGATGRSLSPYKACAIEETTLACYLGLDHFWYRNTDLTAVNKSLSIRSKAKRKKNERWAQLIARYGQAAFLYMDLEHKFDMTKPSSEKLQHLKSLKLIGFMLMLGSKPEIPESAQALPQATVSTQTLPQAAKSAQTLPQAAKSAQTLPLAAKSAQTLPQAAKSAQTLPQATVSAQTHDAPECSEKPTKQLIQAALGLLKHLQSLDGWDAQVASLQENLSAVQAEPASDAAFDSLLYGYMRLREFSEYWPTNVNIV